ncbi:unnamed protein product, partial [Prorocentrum cordatum]
MADLAAASTPAPPAGWRPPPRAAPAWATARRGRPAWRQATLRSQREGAEQPRTPASGSSAAARSLAAAAAAAAATAASARAQRGGCGHGGWRASGRAGVRVARRQGTHAAEATAAVPVPVPALEDAAEQSAARVARSLEVLSEFSEESHPGHQPGRFAGPGAEYDGMEYDGVRWHLKQVDLESEGSNDGCAALATLSEADRTLATRFEGEGGLALCLSSAFKRSDGIREEARRMLEQA